MELRHLRYFVAVAEEAHFGRAAARLNIVPPALSMQIRALEQEVGGPLFARTTRRVELTQAGRLFLTEAQRTLAQADHAKDVARRSVRGEIGAVRIGFVGNALLTGKMPSDVRAFTRTHPSAVVELREMAPQAQSEALLAGVIDIGYRAPMVSDDDPGLISFPILKSSLLAAMTTDHPLARHATLKVADLAGQTLIAYGEAGGAGGGDAIPWRNTLKLDGINLVRADSTLGVLAMAACGQAIALVPEPVARLGIANLTHRRIEDLEDVAELIITRRADETSGAVCAFLDIVKRPLT